MFIRPLRLSAILLLLVGPNADAFGQVLRRPPPRIEAKEAEGPDALPDPSATETDTDPPTDDLSAGSAEEQPADPSPDDQSFNLFGETSRFNRFSGWGGVGGTMGQWGMNRSMLIMMPQVQDELILTDDQKVLLRQWSLEMRDRGREMAEAFRPERGEGGQGRGFPGVGEILGMMDSVTQLLRENEAGIARILDKGQRRRLDQIALQMEGATALARPEVAQAVRLLPAQVEAIQQILLQSRTQQVFHWVQQSASMWGRRNGPQGPGTNQAGTDPGPGPSAGPPRRGRPGSAPPPPAPSTPERAESDDTSRNDDAHRNDDDNRPTAEDRASRIEREAQFRQQFDQLRSGSDQIQDRTVAEIMKILNRRQRQRFDRLLGPPFDPTALTFGPPSSEQDRPSDAPASGPTPRSPSPATEEAPPSP